jgi:5-oxoprolinase (ATP-hydrolysing) subunit B
MSAAHPLPRFLDVGERALCVEVGDRIDEALNDLVLALDRQISGARIPGVVETVPTYRSLLITFDPEAVTKERLQALVLEGWPPRPLDPAWRTRWHLPVRYGGDHGEDLEFVARAHGLSTEEVVDLHAGADYRVYMIGFAPGFAYLGGLPEVLHTSRRSEPRLRTPARSVLIGGQQAAVGPPQEIPSGWHLLGRTPVRTYDPARPERPFLFSPGDHVRFHPVPGAEYDSLSADAARGAVVAGSEPVGG